MKLLQQLPLQDLLLYFGLACLCSAFFSGVEAAYLSLNRLSTRRLEASNRLVRPIITLYLRRIDTFITAILGFNVANNILATLLAKAVAEKSLKPIWPEFPFDHPLFSIGFVMVFALGFIVFCEVSPKRIAIHYAEKVALLGAIPMLPVYLAAFPVTWLLSHMSNQLLSLFTDSSKLRSRLPTKDEFLGYIKLGSATGALKEIETTMMENVLVNRHVPVKAFLIPRQDMKALNMQDLPDNLLRSIQQFPYQTIPVYDGGMDNVIGVLSKRKLALREDGKGITKETLTKHLDKPKFIFESKPIIEVLRDMHGSHSELALVTDEHGGLEGIVTYLNIVERFFGKSKNLPQTLSIKRIGSNYYLVNPQTPIEAVNHHFKANLSCDKAQTIGGFVLEELGTIPKSGEQLKAGPLLIIVRESTKRSITKLSIQRL